MEGAGSAPGNAAAEFSSCDTTLFVEKPLQRSARICLDYVIKPFIKSVILGVEAGYLQKKVVIWIFDRKTQSDYHHMR